MANRQGYYNLARFIGSYYPETDQLDCFRVFIPHGDEYKQQLLTLMNVAGTRAAWFTETDEQRGTRAEIWQRAYRETLDKMDCGCEDCEWLIECLENEEFLAALDAAIAGLLSNPASATYGAVNNITQQALGNQQGVPLPDGLMNQTLNDGALTCDKNTLWGSCLYTVVSLNRLNEDFLETMEALTDNQEMLAYVIGAIPVLETLPIDEFIEMADKIRSFVAETYAAGYDADLESMMACDLFCLAVANDCKLTMSLIFEYFKGKAAEVTGFEDVWDGARTIIHAFASWEETLGEGVVFVMMACNVGFMTFLNSALGMDFGHFKLKAKAGIPSDDWEVFCTDCSDVWEHEFDFEFSMWDFTIAAGEYSSGIGFVNDLDGDFPYTVDIRLAIADWGDAALEGVKIYAFSEFADTSAFRGIYYPSGGGAAQTVTADQSGDYTIEIVANTPTPAVIAFQVSNGLTVPGDNVIKKITLSGSGTDPFI